MIKKAGVFKSICRINALSFTLGFTFPKVANNFQKNKLIFLI